VGAPAYSGGNGGGGAGSSASGGVGTAGTANTGGGGGGGGTGTGTGGAGGSGVVILRIPTVNYSSIYTGSPTISTDGAFTILTYTTGTGSYTA
jgi:hypothetical protein